MRRSSGYVKVLIDAAHRKVGLMKRDAAATITPLRVECLAPECMDAGSGRPFFGTLALREHAEAVHTFDDIRRVLCDYLRERFGRPGDYNAEPPVQGIWVWVEDLAVDWVVWSREEGTDSMLLKADYSIDADNQITLGEPTEVVRRTVYDPVKN